jgi:hypothetical protein
MSTPGTTVTMREYHAALDRRAKREQQLRSEMAAVEHDRDDARGRYIEANDRLARIEMEANAIADALGERGLIDLADDVRMLAKLARVADRHAPVKSGQEGGDV